MSESTSAADVPTLGPCDTLGPDETMPRAGVARPSVGDVGPGDVIGRYVVLHELGRGGMGVVFAAFDPQLDRKVALKLMHPDPRSRRPSATTRDLLLREAQALATLNHPNVVTVHDVGRHEGRVFLAMEFVQGRTLAQWQEHPRSWRETLDVYLCAGRGLAVAHGHGLVHRDFKPDNVMLDEHERVRVMDFGLARRPRDATSRDATIPPDLQQSVVDAATDAGRMTGTPAYMSPEQWSQQDADARSDQFSFCVSLFEALYGQRPFAGETLVEVAAHVLEGQIAVPHDSSRAPAWLDRAVRRGLAVDPTERFESMEQCLQFLARGQTRRRRRLAALGIAGLVTVTAGSLFAAHLTERRRIEGCRERGAEIDSLWNEHVATKLRTAFTETGMSFAGPSSETLVAHFDRFAKDWRSTRTSVCLAEDLQDPTLGDRAQWCLDERRIQLEVLLAQMLEIDVGTIEHAVPTAMQLADVAPCGDSVLLERLPTPPPEQRASALALHRDIVRSHALSQSRRKDEALVLAQEAQRDAQALRWPPLLATASHAVGSIQGMKEQYAEAEKSLEDAYFEAYAAGATNIAATAATALVGLTGDDLGRHDDGIRWARLAQIPLRTLGEPAALTRATLLSHRGLIERRAGDYEAAAEHMEQALAIRKAHLGSDHPMLATLLANQGLIAWDAGRYDEADTLHLRALEINESSLGADHPSVARALNNLAILHESVGHYARAEALQRSALSIFEAVYQPEHTEIAMSVNNLGVVAIAQGRAEEARDLHARAVGIWEHVLGPDHPEVAQGLVNLAVAHSELGDADEALRLYQRALEIQQRTLGPTHVKLADTLNNLGVNRFDAGAYADAIPFYERALAILEPALGPAHPRVATALDNLAEAVLASGDPDRAEPLYRRALTIHEQTLPSDHPDLTYTLIGLAQLELARGAPGPAIPLLTRAVRIRDAVSPEDTYTAEARFLLAQALWDAGEDDGRDRVRAHAEADAAEAIYRGRGREAADAVAKWRRDQGPP